MTAASTSGLGTTLERASLVLGSLLMSVGDLLHPEERLDPGDQAVIVVGLAQRWYAAHLLLFVGLLLFVPGFFALARLVAERRPAAGYAARTLLLLGALSLSAIFMGEMLIGRYVWGGASLAEATALLAAFQSVWILGAVALGGVPFFVGVAIAVWVFVTTDKKLRWPAVVLGLGALFIVAEIISAQVLLSQIGNIMIFVAGATFAWYTRPTNTAT